MPGAGAGAGFVDVAAQEAEEDWGLREDVLVDGEAKLGGDGEEVAGF